ncbi:NAD(P)/FAD-dependent oxidoreductase [Leisingera sp. ANG-Vp]|uniref:NAD(P)/FAD-dependent oxidoreductase n=1 Tax=Leisingera sp. ANG-Vp TaxID=1577896 RepID=UPI00068D99AC|nr:NAD(P)/FAD-dependent oxidoreductase [Leisingera sp. ANG-Vp]
MQFDVAVIGGGPSGSVTASLLAMGGASVVLFEATSFPRYQIGESLMVSTVQGLCKYIGALEEVLKAGFIRKPGGVFKWGASSELWTLAFTQANELLEDDANFALHVDRSRFDSILLETAKRHGVEVRQPNRVREIAPKTPHAKTITFDTPRSGREQVTCRFVIDASGSSSPFAKQVGTRVHSKFFNNMAFYGYFEGASRLPSPLQGGGITEAFSEGWAWFLPIQDNLTSVGVVLGAESKPNDGPEFLMNTYLPECRHISGLLKDARYATTKPFDVFRMRSDFSYTTDRLVRDGVFLVGDSAAFLDPLFTTGVHLGTYSGLLAARTILSIMDDTLPDTDLYQEFETRYRYEYELFYHYVVAYYDANVAPNSNFWSTRKVANTTEQENSFYIDLITQGRDTALDYFASKIGLGDFVQEWIEKLSYVTTPEEKALACRRMAEEIHFHFPPPSGPRPFHLGFQDVRNMANGLVHDEPKAEDLLFQPSQDGLRWQLRATTS